MTCEENKQLLQFYTLNILLTFSHSKFNFNSVEKLLKIASFEFFFSFNLFFKIKQFHYFSYSRKKIFLKNFINEHKTTLFFFHEERMINIGKPPTFGNAFLKKDMHLKKKKLIY